MLGFYFRLTKVAGDKNVD